MASETPVLKTQEEIYQELVANDHWLKSIEVEKTKRLAEKEKLVVEMAEVKKARTAANKALWKASLAYAKTLTDFNVLRAQISRLTDFVNLHRKRDLRLKRLRGEAVLVHNEQASQLAKQYHRNLLKMKVAPPEPR